MNQKQKVVSSAVDAFNFWRTVPAPVRGDLVRNFGNEFRKNKDFLAKIIVEETRKIKSEALGEVQELIDICDFAVGLSRQLHGLTIASERPSHRMMEQWLPIGPIGVITAFNFPMAVWGWNAMLALVCGDSVIWKPSEKAGISALALRGICEDVLRANNCPEHLLQLMLGGKSVGQFLSNHPDIPVISATGSTEMGRAVAVDVAKRFGRSVLELGGNNAMIVTPTADLDLATRAIVFSAVGTCGQRCTSLRRLIVHVNVHGDLLHRLRSAYASLKIGDPTVDDDILVGPLIDKKAKSKMMSAIKQAFKEGGVLLFGGQGIENPKSDPNGAYVDPCIIGMTGNKPIVKQETFAPLLYMISYSRIEDAIWLNNDVPQGLSSSIFTNDIREAELFMSAAGSDCGIANVNIGTSGAEIGGAFGGEKETGGGRESGSDAWKNYMRRTTNTINYGKTLPLAQGVKFS